MRNIQVSTSKKPEDRFVMPNPKTKTHQYQFQMALKQQNNPTMHPHRPSPGQKRGKSGNGKGNNKNGNNNNRQKNKGGKNKNNKNKNNKGKGRALDNNKENDVNCKLLEQVPKYDFKKVPKGLKSMGDLGQDQKDLLRTQCQEEGLEIDLD